MNPTPDIDHLLSSKTFSNKEVLKGLLKYIFEESKNGRSLKEADIAIGYFKRGKEFIPGEDTIVRVNVFKLRALLEKYYTEEGLSQPYIIEIPKGNYSLLVKSRQKEDSHPVKLALQVTKKSKAKALVLLLSISLLINVFLVAVFYREKDAREQNPVWASYVKSAQPVYITLGDPFFFRIKDKSSSENNLIVRDITVNSREDLEDRKSKYLWGNATEISALNYPYFSRNNLWPLPSLISTFAKASVETRLQTLSEASIDDIKNNNVIFIANINAFGWMNEFLKKTSLKLYTNPRKISLQRDKDSVVFTVPEFIKGKYEDYALMVKLPGSNNNTITLMGDFHPSGLRGLSSYINNGKTINELSDLALSQYGHFPQYFEMLVKVTSYNYVDFDTKLVHFKSLE